MCGVAGIIAPKASPAWKKAVMRNLLVNASSRGSDATGVAYIDPADGLFVLKNGIKALDFVESADYDKIQDNFPSIVMGHARAATGGTQAGPSNNNNNHPFYGESSKIAMIHNGTIEDDLWRKTVGKEAGISEKYPFKGETDSELFLRMVETCMDSCSSMEEAIQDAAYNIEGGYALVFIREAEPNKIWFVKHGYPIVLALNKKANYIVWGSTNEIIQHAVTTYDVTMGYFVSPLTPKLIYQEMSDETIVTVEMLNEDPWFKVSEKSFVPKGGKIIHRHRA